MASRRTNLAGGVGRALPGLEALEDRCCPTTLSMQGHTLLINGGPGNDVVTVRDDGVGDVVASVKSGGVTKTISAHGVQQVEIHTGDGNDRVSYQTTGVLKTSRMIDIVLGKGSDQVNLDFSRGATAPKLAVDLEGKAGADEVALKLGAVSNTNVNLTAHLGAGVDHLFALLNGNLSGAAQVLLKVSGGASYDGIVVEAQGAIGAAAKLGVDLAGAAGADTLHVDYVGQLNGQLNILEDGGPGPDLVGSNVTLKAGSKGVLNDQVNGGAGDDLLVLFVNDHSHKMKSIKAHVDGGAGNNIALVGPKVQVTHAEID
jgi:hypothetical protein